MTTAPRPTVKAAVLSPEYPIDPSQGARLLLPAGVRPYQLNWPYILGIAAYHGLAGGDLFARLVAHHDVDQDPARTGRGLFRLHDSGGLDGIAGPHGLDPAGFEAAVDGPGRIGPVGDHARNQPEIVHAVHDDAAEIGLAETALHLSLIHI